MFERYRHPFSGKEWNFKAVVASVLFGAICLVMALFGIANPDRGMGAGGGTAAVVNDSIITMQDFRQRQTMMERQSRLPVDQLPAEQREMYQKEMAKRTLEQMIMTEVVYQTAYKQGIWASNGQVRDELMAIPAFQEGGRFVRSHYDGWLQQSGQSSDEFERQIRREIVIHRLQLMFQSASAVSSQELDQMVALNGDMVNFRFVEIVPSIDEKVKARHILLMVNEKNPDAAVLEKAKAIKAKLTPQNFASIAQKESQDTESAKKGGELGFFEKGHMVPKFEESAFKLKPGEISEPVKTEYGYHIIYVEEHQATKKVDVEGLKKAVASGKTSDVDAELKKVGFAWAKAENVVLAAPQVPGLKEPQEVMLAVARLKGKTGLVPNVVGGEAHSYIVDVTGWKANPKKRNKEEIEKSLAMQDSNESFEDWVKDAESKATITRSHFLER